MFDEVDAGIGGHTARAVGERLRELAGTRQVLCITHLPQIASLAARHFTVVKDADRGQHPHAGGAAGRARGAERAGADAGRPRARPLGAPPRARAAQGGVRGSRKAA